MEDRAYFLLYYLAFFLSTSCFTAFGVILPFFSASTGRDESEFSILLMMRGAGYVLGGLIKLWCMRKVDLHRGLSIGCLLAGFGCLLLTPSLSMMVVSGGSLIMSVGLFMIEVFGNMSIIKRSEGDERYLRMNFFWASLGSMTVSLSISLFSFRAIRVLGIVLLLVGMVIFALPPFPEEKT